MRDLAGFVLLLAAVFCGYHAFHLKIYYEVYEQAIYGNSALLLGGVAAGLVVIAYKVMTRR